MVPRLRHPVLNPASWVPTPTGAVKLCPPSSLGAPAGVLTERLLPDTAWLCSWEVLSACQHQAVRDPPGSAACHLALLVTTFKAGSAQLAFAEGHQKEAHWPGPLLTSLWGQQGPGHFQPMCYISGPVKRRMGRTGHGHRGTIRDAVVPAPETLDAA